MIFNIKINESPCPIKANFSRKKAHWKGGLSGRREERHVTDSQLELVLRSFAKYTALLLLTVTSFYPFYLETIGQTYLLWAMALSPRNPSPSVTLFHSFWLSSLGRHGTKQR